MVVRHFCLLNLMQEPPLWPSYLNWKHPGKANLRDVAGWPRKVATLQSQDAKGSGTDLLKALVWGMACDSWGAKRDQRADHSLSEVISSTHPVSSLRFGGMSTASCTLISAATKSYYSLLSAILDSLYQNFHKASDPKFRFAKCT